MVSRAAAFDVGSGKRPERRLVGRQAELRRILAALDMARKGRGNVVLLSGEPGIGKTRLAHELVARARAGRARVLVGRCFEQHTTVPFFPFTEAVGSALSGAPGDFQTAARHRWPELTHVVPDTERTAPELELQETQLGVFRAVTGLLNTLAEQTLVVVLLEDLHWADATSLALLLYLGRHLAHGRILVIGTYRDTEVGLEHPLDDIVRELVRDRLADEVHLGPLGMEETAALIRAYLAAQDVAHDLLALVHGRAEGNPFFTEELLKALLEQGGAVEVRGRWQPTTQPEVEVPHSVRSVVAHRLRRLPLETQELLRLASVIGQTFDLDVLMGASQQPAASVLDQLDQALSARLIEDARDQGNEYAFVHALIQQALYAESSRSQLRTFHERIAETLAARGLGRPLAAARLVRHFLAAGDTERAIPYAIQAGQHAAADYAHAEAVRHYRIAVHLLQQQNDHARAADVQLRLASELYDLNQLPDAVSTYQAGLATFKRMEDTTGQARAYRGIGLIEAGRYVMAAAVRDFEAALQLWPIERNDAELGWLLLDTARAHFFTGNPSNANSLAERAMVLAKNSDNAGLLARSLALVACTRLQTDPRPRVTKPLLDEAEHVARVAGDWRALSYVYLVRADWHELSFDLIEALADRRRATEAAERSGETERLAFAHFIVAESCLWAGEWEEGRRTAHAGLDLDPHHLLRSQPGLAHLLWMEGRPEDALQHIHTYIADARRRGDRQGIGTGLWRLAQLALQLDRPAEADLPAREAAELLRVGGDWMPWVGFTCGTLAEAAVRVAASEADQILTTAENTIKDTEQYYARSQLLRARALLLQRQGRLEGALETFTASADADRSQHSFIQLGWTLNALAGVARQCGEARLAAEADAELVQLVDRIGPEVRVLPWARGAPTAAYAATSIQASQSSKTAASDVLTRRERQVAQLVARGLTNRQIADALTIAEGTAGVHVDHILSKLGFRSRAQVAAWAVEHSLLKDPS